MDTKQDKSAMSADELEVVAYRRPGTTFLFNDTTHPQDYEALCLVADAQRQLAQRDADIGVLKSLLREAHEIIGRHGWTTGEAATYLRIEQAIGAKPQAQEPGA